MPEPDLKTILEDVKTIKAILQTADAPIPPVWHLLYWVASPAVVLIGALKLLVPAWAAMNFLDTLLWLWTPVMSLVAVIVAVWISRELRRVGTKFLAQGRIQVFLYTRLIVVPAVVTLGYLLSLNPAYSMEGAMLVLASVGMVQVVGLVPGAFRMLPFAFLFAGFLELVLNLRGPLWTLANTWAVAAMLAFVGSILQKFESQGEAAHG